MGAQGPKGEVGDVLYVGRNCKELLDQGVIMSGWYTIYPDGMAPLQVLCDMDTDGGGWIVFQRRYDGSVDFYLGWDSYKKGFGSRLTDFWLGNDNLSNLTSAGTWDLRVDLRDFNNSAYYAKYSSFQISPASDNYTLTFGAFLGGNAGDSLSYHNQTSFSTKDRDNDRSLTNCAVEGFGAWWFNDCFLSDLNGVYQLQQSGNSFGITWQSANDYSYYSFKRSEMKIRPV
ncbi:ficolin-2 [Xenopus laevis]|nr:ficolin-2 [Xenopus laevis]XP_041421707.1 ficolin-2 [Xenopus laevis]XP_041421708.1 ficolin-2 [Xenopus laevis]XP_041421709.1 ficolin-2 [Xenopus laevis]XP_041421710.1 ficolin-2 [Xenopus laevis]